MNPCGMAVDVRQRFRAYTCDARFFADRPDLLTRIRWYTVPKNREFLPFEHGFMSRRWERDWPQLPIGEIQDSFKVCRDVPVPGAYGLGYCGTEQQWQNGAIYAPAPPLNPDNQLPACCPKTFVGRGGLAVGGVPAPPYQVCTRGLPLWFTVGVSSFSAWRPWTGFLYFYWSGSNWQCVTPHALAGGGNTLSWTLSYVEVGLLPFMRLDGDQLEFVALAEVLCPPVAVLVDGENGKVPYPASGLLLDWFAYFGRLESAAGGQAAGGYGIRHAGAYEVGRGGQAAGGLAVNLQVLIGHGGSATGGSGATGSPRKGVGGLAAGGRGYDSVRTLGRGGQGQGGRGILFSFHVGQGGIAQGGLADPP